MRFKYLLILPFIAVMLSANAQSKTNADSIATKMQWFADAKLGIFIHWGIYSVNGVDESWSFYNKKLPYKDYMSQLKGFTAKNYKPEEWAALIKESGARYSVITTKHHDGVALWKTAQSKLNVVESTPAKRDLLKPFYEALRKENIKCGAYFSILDWSHQDYTGFLKDSSRYKIASQLERWKKFQSFYMGQLKEVMGNYKPDLIWFDGDWEHSNEEWNAPAVRSLLLGYNPNVIINGRLQGYGDYETPEQNFPITRPKFHWWELCMTTNDNWGYHPDDTNYKTPSEVISIFVDAVSNGGNLLLDIGPAEDGTIPAPQVNILKELGKWNKKYGEAIFETLGGLPQGHFAGPTTISKDSSTIYLFVPGHLSGDVTIKGLDTKIKKITALNNGENVKWKIVGKISWSAVPGLVFVHVPPTVKDEYMSVLKVELEKPLKLYRGSGGL